MDKITLDFANGTIARIVLGTEASSGLGPRHETHPVRMDTTA